MPTPALIYSPNLTTENSTPKNPPSRQAVAVAYNAKNAHPDHEEPAGPTAPPLPQKTANRSSAYQNHTPHSHAVFQSPALTDQSTAPDASPTNPRTEGSSFADAPDSSSTTLRTPPTQLTTLHPSDQQSPQKPARSTPLFAD